jgi:hypothetical protein
MEQNVFMLSATTILGALAALFAIIGVATPGWPYNKNQLLGCGATCDYNYTAAGVLLIIAIVFLIIAGLLAVMFLQRYIASPADRIKALALALLVIAVIFIVSAYSCTLYRQNYNYYSYHLTVTAGILAFLSTIFFTYWIGRTSVVISYQ